MSQNTPNQYGNFPNNPGQPQGQPFPGQAAPGNYQQYPPFPGQAAPGNYQQYPPFPGQPAPGMASPMPNPAAGQYPNQKSKLVAGLLGIFLGGFGVHNFYLGRTGRAVLQLVITLLSFGIASIWGFIEGILILAAKPGSSWALDAEGIPLRD
ncbi:TM2 domain-containing protein [Varibaculum vaginae]|uniref:TM2 domain-containing protein n=1 Tax=Varibaculum vaginae TaxID=2364797 RepID=UPI000F07BB9A|nr:TM2 domain-containing protein [Varibaculum vaginae]